MNVNRNYLRRIMTVVALLLTGILAGSLTSTKAQADGIGLSAVSTSSAKLVPNAAWQVVPSPNTGSPINHLVGVAALATDDVWAVGAYGNLGIAAWQVIEHWNGTGWIFAKSPTLTKPNELLAVSAVSSNDVWAVGGFDTGGQSLIEHWDGSQWTVVTNPNPGTLNRFFGVSAVSTDDVWALGYFANGGLSQTLVEHWNGVDWNIVSSPNVLNQYNQLESVTAVPGSPNELWAVGTAGSSTLVEHWDGTQWSIVSSPNPGSDPDLTSVAAISTNDVWAVGHTGSQNGPVTLTEHWDGSKWSVVSSPNPSLTSNHLSGVAVLAPNNVWAVGDFINLDVHNNQTLILQWNGTQWAQVPGDNTGPSGLGFELTAVTAIGANDIWSVGDDSHTLAEHWNGQAWSIVSSPNAGVGGNVINAISPAASSDVWEVGYNNFGLEERTLIEHRNGSNWSLVPSPNTNKVNNVLNGVVAISPTNVWAVGNADSRIVEDQTTLILHWDGNAWSIVPSPSPGSQMFNELFGVAGLSANDVWAVGSFANSGALAQTLVEHWNGSAWSVVPSPNVPGTNNGLYGVLALGAKAVGAVGYYGSGVFSTLTERWNGSTWSIVPSPTPQNTSSILRAVSATAARDIWAVGYATNLQTNTDNTLTEHWNGRGWSIVFGVNPFPGPNDLFGVVAVSTGNAWEVGTGGGLTLIGHWDGSRWSVFPSPNVTGRLNAATAITACDVWAAGQAYEMDGSSRTLDEHFAC